MTPAWMSGYAGDVAYTLGFYRELAPSFLNYVTIITGYEGIPSGRRVRYCELGCGRGYGTVLLAAANPQIDFIGVDFNPAHIGEARALASEAGADNVTFFELSFAEAARATDAALDDLDVVVAHGVYTWVSDAVRQDLITFLAAKLVPGGLAYVSYNTLPGWAPFLPAQHILKTFADRGAGNSVERFRRGYDLLKELATKSVYVKQNPGVKSRIDRIESQDIHYLVGEYLNDQWQPIYVDQALAAFAEAKLDFIGSASVAENRPVLCVPSDLISKVGGMPDSVLREMLKDFAINKQFRRDVYVKGARRLDASESRRRYLDARFRLVSRPDPISEEWLIPAGKATIKMATLQPIFDVLDQGESTGGEILDAVSAAGGTESDVAISMEILVHNNVVTPAPGGLPDDVSVARRLNRVIIDRAKTGDTHRYLAAPTIGSAIGVGFVERLAASLIGDDPQADDRTVAGRIFDVTEAAKITLRIDGRPITRKSRAAIADRVAGFRRRGLPQWKELGVID